jgi:hypothetical protein
MNHREIWPLVAMALGLVLVVQVLRQRLDAMNHREMWRLIIAAIVLWLLVAVAAFLLRNQPVHPGCC